MANPIWFEKFHEVCLQMANIYAINMSASITTKIRYLQLSEYSKQTIDVYVFGEMYGVSCFLS